MPTLLVVEDSPAMAHMYREFLVKEPYDVTVAATWSEAKSVLEEATPDLMLLDVQLPDGDGLELLRDLQSRKPDRCDDSPWLDQCCRRCHAGWRL